MGRFLSTKVLFLRERARLSSIPPQCETRREVPGHWRYRDGWPQVRCEGTYSYEVWFLLFYPDFSRHDCPHSLFFWCSYQVRIALLQAAHYGTPQSRIRFFLIAAQQSCALPPFPIPIYDFPLKDSMEFKLSQLGEHITPISVVAGLAPFKFITIDDAIGDLPRFDWWVYIIVWSLLSFEWRLTLRKNPKRPHQVKRRIEDPEDPDETIDVPILTCDYSKSSCGLNDARYQLARPHTLFQVKCREKPVGQLQHLTRTWQENTIERWDKSDHCEKLTKRHCFDPWQSSQYSIDSKCWL